MRGCVRAHTSVESSGCRSRILTVTLEIVEASRHPTGRFFASCRCVFRRMAPANSLAAALATVGLPSVSVQPGKKD